MYRIQIEVTLWALVVVLGVAMAGLWLESLSAWVLKADLVQTGYVALCVLASAALAGVGAGLRYGLASWPDTPAREKLKKALRPTFAAAVTACIIIMWASFQMATIPSTAELEHAVLKVARWLDIGILLLCVTSAISLVLDSRRTGTSPQVP